MKTEDETYIVIDKLLLQAERRAKTIDDNILCGHLGQIRRLFKTYKIKPVISAVPE